MAAPERCKGPAKHCPSWRWDCQGGDTLGDKGTHTRQCRCTTTVLPIPTSGTHTDGSWEAGNLYWVWRRQERLIWGRVVLAQATSTGPQVQECPPSTPGWAVPPGWSHLSSGCHLKDPTSISAPMTAPPSACGDLVIPGVLCPLLAPAPHQPLAGDSCVTHNPSKPLARWSLSQSPPCYPLCSHLPLRSEEQRARVGTVPRMSPMPGWLKFRLQEPS